MNFDAGSVSRTLPSSIIIMIETPTTGLVIDMMRKMASFGIGFRDSMSIRPCASKWAMRPFRATSVTAPEKLPAVMWRCTSSLIRCRRSVEKPTSSGFAVGVAAAIGHASTTAATMTRAPNLRIEPPKCVKRRY